MGFDYVISPDCRNVVLSEVKAKLSKPFISDTWTTKRLPLAVWTSCRTLDANSAHNQTETYDLIVSIVVMHRRKSK